MKKKLLISLIAIVYSIDTSIALAKSINPIDLRAFIWDKNNGMQDLGTLRSDGIGTSVAYGISRDGTIVVGAADAGGTSHAFKWHKDTGMIDLGSLTADNKGRSYARSVSSDGEYIVGASHNDIAPDIYQAFIWHKSTGMRDLTT